jgi:DNA helicase-2/ATP-dependent DNA helicase PcrA
MVPQRFYVHGQRAGGDRHLYAARTRFIPSNLLRLFEACAWPRPAAATAAAKTAHQPVDIRARMRRMWR